MGRRRDKAAGHEPHYSYSQRKQRESLERGAQMGSASLRVRLIKSN